MLVAIVLEKCEVSNYRSSRAKNITPCAESIKTKSIITSREREVLELISNGMTNQEIAKEMHLSPHTTETHRRHLMCKLEARNQANLVKIGMERGLI